MPIGKPVRIVTNQTANKTRGIITYAVREKNGRKIIMNFILGSRITYKPAIANIAPEAPTMNISGEPKILAPNSVLPKNPASNTDSAAANNPERM